MQRRYTYTVRIEKIDGGGYVAFVPAMPGCHTHGDTYEAAFRDIAEAIHVHAEDLLRSGHRVPVEFDHRELHLQVSLPAVV